MVASEPGAGSDIFGLQTRALKRGDQDVLMGHKNVRDQCPTGADFFVTYATMLDPALGATGITAFIVNDATPGLSLSRKLDKMGLGALTDGGGSGAGRLPRVRPPNGSDARAAASRYSSVRWSGAWPHSGELSRASAPARNLHLTMSGRANSLVRRSASFSRSGPTAASSI